MFPDECPDECPDGYPEFDVPLNVDVLAPAPLDDPTPAEMPLKIISINYFLDDNISKAAKTKKKLNRRFSLKS